MPSMLARTAVLAALCAPLTAQAPPPFDIGPLTVQPGTKVSASLEVAAALDAGTEIPITVVHGAAAGPVLALIAGTHGSEVAPIIALQRVRAALDPATLRGTVILVHIANVPSFLSRTIYYGPGDGKNLNRVYPGRADGTVSERIAHVITTEVISRAHYLVDMHAGDGNESLRPYTYWSRLGLDARADSIGRAMALAWGNDLIVVDTTRPSTPGATIYTQSTAHVRGKPALTTESGYLGTPDEAMIRSNEQGALRLMRYLGMLPGSVELVERPIWLTHTEVSRSPGTGVWHPAVERAQTVVEGQVLGRLTDFFGDELAVVRAPIDGTVLYIVATPAMSEGEPVAMVGRAGRP